MMLQTPLGLARKCRCRIENATQILGMKEGFVWDRAEDGAEEGINVSLIRRVQSGA